MCFPVIHSFAGYSVYKFSKEPHLKADLPLIASSIFLANAADFDYVPGLMIQDALYYHRGYTHTLGAALMAGIIAAFLFQIFRKDSFLKIFFVSFFAYFTHIVLDFFNATGRPMILFWPFSSK